ncbi:MAG: hypothetical protein KDE22_06255 [Rhodobacterales bacterium]|nr:hypothetical protein [Rhodobacterales bacterium]
MWRSTGFLSILALAMVLLAGAVPPAAAGDGVPLPHPAKGKGLQCVEPVDAMRRYHMKYLMHQRDDTVHGGIRGAKYSLQGCIDCHAVADPKVMNGEKRTLKPFCGACHEYAGVTLDCFQCHSPVAEDKPNLSQADAQAVREAHQQALKSRIQQGN